MTVQRAFDRLLRDGYVYSRTREGTFVAERPPHLSRVGLVFPRRPSRERPWSRFWIALQQAAMALQGSPGAEGIELPQYFSCDARPDSEDFGQMLRDVEHDRVAGLIFVTPPHDLADTTILQRENLPRVAVMTQNPWLKMPAVFPDMNGFLDRALQYLCERGRRRVAMLCVPHWPQFLEHARAEMQRRNLTCKPQWIQVVHPDTSDSARGVVHLLFDGATSPQERPDALIITDDHLADPAAAGLIAAGVGASLGDVEVVAHCNFPWPNQSAVPMRRLGFDAHAILRRAVQAIDLQREGNPAPDVVTVPAVFEEELNANFPAVGGER
jgi:DNA-binding LacI/PurR family transcriptional regulator